MYNSMMRSWVDPCVYIYVGVAPITYIYAGQGIWSAYIYVMRCVCMLVMVGGPDGE